MNVESDDYNIYGRVGPGDRFQFLGVVTGFGNSATGEGHRNALEVFEADYEGRAQNFLVQHPARNEIRAFRTEVKTVIMEF